MPLQDEAMNFSIRRLGRMREEKEHVVTVVTTRLVKPREERRLNLFLFVMASISLSTGTTFLIRMPLTPSGLSSSQRRSS